MKQKYINSNEYGSLFYGNKEKKYTKNVIMQKRIFRYSNCEFPYSSMCENKINELFNMRYSLLTTNGTSALKTALIGSGVKEGDRVLISSYTFLATALAPISIGAVPIPIEIKSPGEETEISVKAIRQALENKIIFLSRQQYKTDNETTSLAIGYNLPNMRSEVFELIEDIHNSFNFNICVLSFTDLLVMAVSVINSGKEISIQNFRTLKGVYNVKKLNNN